MSKPNLLNQVETITWYSVHDSMPDDEQTVMIRIPSPAEPTWIGFHDSNDGWHYIEGMKINYAVTHWAELPEGPKE